jgi:hypothetical protein
MQLNAITSTRRRAWATTVLSDYTGLSTTDLVRETAELHRDLELTEGVGFSPAAALGLRHVLLEQLVAIDHEHERRLGHATQLPRPEVIQ